MVAPHSGAADDVEHPRLVLQIEKRHPARRAGALSVGDQTRHLDPAAVMLRSQILDRHHFLGDEGRPQVAHRMITR